MSPPSTTTDGATRAPIESWIEVGAGWREPFAAGDPVRLAEVYWRSADRAVFGLVRSVGAPLGPVTLRAVSARGPNLLRLGPAVVAVDPRRLHVAFPILDGLVVATPGGRLVLAAERDGAVLRLGVRVEGYTPRLHGAGSPIGRLVRIPYAFAQGRVHDRVTSTYLRNIAARP